MQPHRLLVPTLLAAALLTTGCSTATQSTASTEPSKDCVSAGAASDAVKVSGDFGGTLELTSDVPISSEELQRTVITEGDGDALASGAEVTATVTMINGTSGEVVNSYPETALTVAEDQLVDWVYAGVQCAVVGQRAVVTVPATDAFGDELTDSGYESGDTLVAVFDVTAEAPGTLADDALLAKAEGTAKEVPAGLPTVKLADDGEPTITVAKDSTAPSELKIATLIEGEGDEVKEGDRVYVHYTGVIWSSGEVFDSSWVNGAPVDFLTSGVIPGFSEALVGQKVGSQVMSVVPPESGYGATQLESMGYKADDVMVFVLDILGTVHAK